MMDRADIIDISRRFGIRGELKSHRTLTAGHINVTCLLTFDDGGKEEKYLLQAVNTDVFKDPDALMDNIIAVTAHLRKKIRDGGGGCCRIYKYVDGTHTILKTEDREQFKNAGTAFGRFQRQLSDFPMDRLRETIPDFHNTPERVRQLLAAHENAVQDCEQAQRLFDFAMERSGRAGAVIELFEDGRLPLRVTHNDTKISNVLLDDRDEKAVCVIDLDTVMPGFSIFDFGDAIRSGATNAAEDEKDLSLVTLNRDYFAAYAEGWLGECRDALTQCEKENLVTGAWMMTFECAIRFLADYFNGNVYFGTAYPEHNLDRAANQLKLLEEIEKSEDDLKEIISRHI